MGALKCFTWTTRLDKILEKVELGDLVCFHRGLFVHHAVYVGRGRAVHHHLGSCDGEVIEATMEYLAKCDLMKVVKVKDSKFSPREVVRRARSQIGPMPYSLYDGNCEHFTTWVYYDVRQSSQLSGLCQYELRLLRIVKHNSTLHSTAAAVPAVYQRGRSESDSEEDDFVFAPPRPVKYRHAKNPASVAWNHARSCLKVLAIQSAVSVAAVPLYKCGLQADNLQLLGRQISRRRRLRQRKAAAAAVADDLEDAAC